MDSTRDELVGFCTLASMGLLGMALYSGTYSLIYASIGISTPPVAILEMWMTTVHLMSAAGCCVLQGIYVSMFKKSNTVLPHLSEAQTSLFLGVACAVTILGNNCLQYGECATYYGAASFPRIAAAGSVAWAWVMYVSSLGCQSWTKGGLSMGFSDKQGVTAASVMLMLPCTVGAKLNAVCGEVATDGTTPILLMLGGLLLLHAPQGLMVIRVLGSLVFFCAFISTGQWGVYNVTGLALAMNALLAEVWRSSSHVKPSHHASKHRA